jgi:RNA polymerase subunit RPABC4/transcription elongation factor Spt4
MAKNLEGQKCPVCTSYLFPEDDIVYCPICGAPHHRDCYNSIGHCGLEEFHGTEKQYTYTPPEEKAEQHKQSEHKTICQNCKNELSDDMLVCPYCGVPKNARVFAFDYLGGVDPKKDLGEGVTAAEAAKMVTVNTHRYIPKFAKLSKFNKISFNWLAFLLPEGWFFSRKMYKQGALATCAILAAQILNIPLLKILNGVVLNSYAEYAEYVVNNMSTFGKLPIRFAFISIVITLAVKLISGIFADYSYKNSVITKCKQLNKQNNEQSALLRKLGGVNFFGFLLGVLITNYLPNIILMFF